VPTFDFSGTPGFSMEAFAAMFMAQGWLPPGAAAPANGFHGYTIDPNLRLSDRMTDFLNLVRQKKTSRSRVVDYAATLHIFKELVGDLPLAELKPSHTDVFLEAMRVWPSHASKRREFRNMEAPAVVRKAQMLRQTPIDLRTQQQHVGRLRAFFIYLERRHEIRPDLLRGIRLVTKKSPTNRSRLPFDEAQLDTIFASPQITGTDEPFKFWLPMLALYTGARVRELAQLYVDDVSERDGDWFISIAQNRPGQRLKNLQSERMVPVHNRLIAAGFLEYVEDARRAGLVRLFPGLNWQAANGPGDQVSDWFNRTLRKQIGIQGWELTFHSFRHCFATFASRSQVRDILIEELLGHDTGHSTLNTYYVGLSHLKEKRRALNLIAFPPLIHTVYRRGRFDRVFHQATRAQARAAQIASVYPASP
jgi:integrase